MEMICVGFDRARHNKLGSSTQALTGQTNTHQLHKQHYQHQKSLDHLSQPSQTLKSKPLLCLSAQTMLWTLLC